MKNQLLTGFICLGLTCSGFLVAEDVSDANDKTVRTETKRVLYKTIDANGKVTYSDKPSKDAKKIPMSEGQSINLKPPKVNFYSSNEDQYQDNNTQSNGYSSVSFIQPENDGVLRNNGGVATFEISIKPKLAKTDHVIFYIDGQQVDAMISGMSVTISNVEYGTHSASFAIADNNDRVRIKSGSLTFNLLHTVRRKVGAAIQNNSPINQINSGVLMAAKLKIKLPEHPKPVDHQKLRKREY